MARTLVSARHGAKRCYAPFPYRCSSGATDGGGDFGREIILLLLDAFAELETHIAGKRNRRTSRSEEHTSELQSLMRISYAVFCLKTKTKQIANCTNTQHNTTTRKH